MATDIVMPQMGESIVEGTITKWLKKAGDKIQRDEPLFEISTDKVDAEIPAPASGVLQEIKVTEGTTVQVNTVVGTISSLISSKKYDSASGPMSSPRMPKYGTPASAPSRVTSGWMCAQRRNTIGRITSSWRSRSRNTTLVGQRLTPASSRSAACRRRSTA